MNSIERMFQHCLLDVDRTVRTLFDLDWNRFGTRIVRETENGFPKYQGFMFVAKCGKLQRAIVSGLLLNHEQSSNILMKKFGVLKKNPMLGYSMQVRNPEEGFWGGAIRRSIPGTDDVFGGTGLPEVADHLVTALCMKKNHFLCSRDFEYVTNFKNKCMRNACVDVGITEESYQELLTYIGQIVQSIYNR